MKKIGIVIHGGASDSDTFTKNNLKRYEEGLAEAANIGFKILKRGGSAINAVEEAVKCMEDNYIFNAGKGSALNNRGEVEMDASIMDGKTMRAGAVSMLKSVKNPISAAKAILKKTDHVLLSGYGALEFAINEGLAIEPDSYFITDYQYDYYLKLFQASKRKSPSKSKKHGTVGAVALDKNGNLASGTSTGGMSNTLPGRVGDSCIIGAGCYANNRTCAVSGTGHGEFLILGVIAHSISMLLADKKFPIQKICEFVVNRKNQFARGEMGVISIDRKGNLGLAYNTEIMKRAWITSSEDLTVKIYK